MGRVISKRLAANYAPKHDADNYGFHSPWNVTARFMLWRSDWIVEYDTKTHRFVRRGQPTNVEKEIS